MDTAKIVPSHIDGDGGFVTRLPGLAASVAQKRDLAGYCKAALWSGLNFEIRALSALAVGRLDSGAATAFEIQVSVAFRRLPRIPMPSTLYGFP